MAKKKQRAERISREELEQLDGQELPERAVMSLLPGLELDPTDPAVTTLGELQPTPEE
jgi:hypothetical protein